MPEPAIASGDRSILRELVAFARRNTLSTAGGIIGLLIVVMAITAPWVAPQDPLKTNFRHMNKPPDAEALFGTDQVGRDTLSRVIYGARTSLFVAFSAVLLGTTVGSLWGVACGYLGGRFDLASQRVMEILQAFPDLILAMAISVAIGTGLPAVIIAIAITRLPFGGRVIRSVAISVREMSYVEAGRATGASALRIMRLHVLPRLQPPGRRDPRHPRSSPLARLPPSRDRGGAERACRRALAQHRAARRRLLVGATPVLGRREQDMM